MRIEPYHRAHSGSSYVYYTAVASPFTTSEVAKARKSELNVCDVMWCGVMWCGVNDVLLLRLILILLHYVILILFMNIYKVDYINCCCM